MTSNAEIGLVLDDVSPEIRAIEAMLDLDNVDRLILRYKIEYPDIKASKLAKILKIDESILRYRLRKPAFQLAERRLTQTTDDILLDAARTAAMRLVELIDHQNPMIALGAVRVALTRHLAQRFNPSDAEVIAYQTSIAADGNLLQDVIREEMITYEVKAEKNGGKSKS